MKCHEILNISESATYEDITDSYLGKMQALEKSRALLQACAYDTKAAEYLDAKEACLMWLKETANNRISQRAKERAGQASDVRLYDCAPCCGPLTLLDNCGSACMGSSTCYSTGCEGILYVDLCIMGIAGFFALKAWKNKRDVEALEEQRERAERAKKENDNYRAQISICQQDERKLQSRVQSERAELDKLQAFSDLFSALGAEPATPVIESQHNRVVSTTKAIETAKQKESNLKDKIRDNERIISNGGRY